MEVNLIVPKGTDVSVILAEYPDLYEDEWYGDDLQSYWNGHSIDEDESEDFEWMTYDDCVSFCGFCEGAIESARTCLGGNGGWAQSMIRCRDFSTYAVSEADKREWKDTSDRYWTAHAKGKAAADATRMTQD